MTAAGAEVCKTVLESKLVGVWMELFNPDVVTLPSETSAADLHRIHTKQTATTAVFSALIVPWLCHRIPK